MNLVTVSLVLAVFAVIALLVVRSRGDNDRARNLCEIFGLDPDEYEVVATDLGGSDQKFFLRTSVLSGVPDAVFRHRRTLEIVIGEAKSRHYRNRVKVYERYQVTLYLGAAETVFNKPTRGIIHYGCGTLVEVSYSAEEYSYLLSLVPDFRRVQKKIQSS